MNTEDEDFAVTDSLGQAAKARAHKPNLRSPVCDDSPTRSLIRSGPAAPEGEWGDLEMRRDNSHSVGETSAVTTAKFLTAAKGSP